MPAQGQTQYRVTPLAAPDDANFSTSSEYLAANGSVAYYGNSPKTGTQRAFDFDGNGVHELTLGGSYTNTYVTGINSSGHALGFGLTSGGVEGSFIWRNATEGIVPLGTLGGTNSYPVAINDADQVTGYSSTSSGYVHAFLWSPTGGMTDLGTLGGTTSEATVINASGQVAGYSVTSSGNQHAFMWSMTGGMVDLGTLGGTTSYPNSINASGQVVGFSYTGSGYQHAFIWSSSGGMIDLGTLGGSSNTSNAYHITSAGHVFGYSYLPSGQQSAYFYDGASMHSLLPGGAVAINFYGQNSSFNDLDQATGYVHLSDGTNHAFLSNGSAVTDLGTMGGTEEFGEGINDLGQVVGFGYTANNASQEAFLYASGATTVLNQALATGSGVQLQFASAINDTGQIVGGGTFYGLSGAYLLTPLTGLKTDPNKATPSLINLSSPTITWTTPLTMDSGSVSGSGATPTGAVAINYGGLTQFTAINPDGTFSANLITAPLSVGSYVLTYTYLGDANYNSATATGTLTAIPATPTIIINGGTYSYDGDPHSATGEVLGVNKAYLGTPSFTYNGSSSAPVDAGTYAVVASYAAAGNYAASSANATLVIGNTPTTNYTVTQLGPSDDPNFSVAGQFLSASGSVAFYGYSSKTSTYRAFVYDGTALHELTLGGTYAQVNAVNSSGHVVGYGLTSSGFYHAFIWRNATEGIVDLGTLGGSSSYAQAINDSDQVAGSSLLSTGYQHAILWSPTVGMMDLGSLGGPTITVTSVNSSGQIAGTGDINSGYQLCDEYFNGYNDQTNCSNYSYRHAFFWSSTGGMKDLGAYEGQFSNATSLNSSGTIAGDADINQIANEECTFYYFGICEGSYLSFFYQHAVAWNSSGGLTDLGTLGSLASSAQQITSDGHVFGSSSLANGSSRAFEYSGFMTSLLPSGATSSYFYNNGFNSPFNDADQATGYAGYPDGTTHAFLSNGSTVTDLGTPGTTYTDGMSINDLGQVVGYGYTTNSTLGVAFLYANGAMTDLNQTLASSSGGQLQQAFAINHNGQILGSGTFSGARKLFLLTPQAAGTQNPTVSVTGGTFTFNGSPQGATGFAYGVGGLGDVLSPPVTFSYIGAGTSSYGPTATPPTGAGTYQVTASFAGNPNYTSASNTTTLTILGAPPVLTSAGSATFTAVSAGSFSVTTTGTPIPALSETGALPAGTTFTDNGNGTATLGGTPIGGTGALYSISITASNGIRPNAVQNFKLTVDEAPSFIAPTASNATFTVGIRGTAVVQATGFPTPVLSELGALPNGVTFFTETGFLYLLDGIPTAGTTGTYNISYVASNGVGLDAVQGLALIVNPATTTISINNIPAGAAYGGSFTPIYTYVGDGTTSTTSGTTSTCTVTSGVVNFVGVGICTLTAHAAAGTNYAAVDGSAQSVTISSTSVSLAGPQTTVPTSIWNGLVAYYPFDRDSNDYSSFGNNLQLNGGASIVANGEFGGALSLGNSASSETDYAIASGDNPNLDFGSSDFTIQTWVNFADVSRIETILEKFTGAGGPGWSLSNIPGELEFYGSSGSSDKNFSFQAGVWYQIMVVHSGGSVTVYVNTTGGGLNSIGSAALGAIPNSTNPLLVGIRDLAAGQPLGFNGLIDDIAIWDRALTTSEISLLNTNSLSSLPQTSFSVNICPGGQTTPAPCSQTGTLNYNINADTTFGANPTVLTLGAPNLDFTLSSTTCAGTITAGNSCTVNVSFAPLAPGVRMGAVQLTDSSGNLLVTTLVHGIGQGPAIAFGPGVQTTVSASELNRAFGVAVDGAGDVFISDPNNSRVVKVPAGGGAQTTVGTGLTTPAGLAVDGAGDVFIADQVNNQVVEVPAGGGPQITVSSGLNSPFGVAVDGAGDVFIADTNNDRVVEVPSGGGAQITVSSGLNRPYGVAVDGAGDLFVTDTANGRVLDFLVGGGTTTVGSGLSGPGGVAVDGVGNVFIADSSNNRVVEVPAGGGAQFTVGTGLDHSLGVTVDGAGDVFIADDLNFRVVEVQRTQPPTFSYAATVVGNTSTDSPQSVTVQNIGNQPLAAVLPGLSISSNSFVQVAGSGNPADCDNAFSLAPGASCNLSVSFVPQTTGSFVSSATFIDNALNAPAVAPATQSVTLDGTGQAASQTISFTQSAPASASYYSAFTVAAQSTSGLTVTLSVDSASTSVCSVGTPSVASGVTTATVAMLSATGTCTIDASQLGNSVYNPAVQLQTSATAAIIGISLTVTNTNDSGFGSLRNAIANASSGDTINFSLAYPATIALSSTLPISTSLTISGPGASNVMISGNGSVQVFNIGGGITATISGLTIQNGSSSVSSGGGIYNSGTLMLSNSTLSGNSVSGGFAGGAIYNGGTLTLSNSTLSGNSASNGGGIFNGGGTLTINNSTLSGNSAIGFGFSAVGAGIYIYGGTVTLNNSTFSGNSAGVGGGIYTLYATVTLNNSTLSGNSASFYGGGAIFVYNGTVTSKNTILANNSLGNCGYPGMISQGYNLSDDTSCSGALTQTGDLNDTPAGLDPNGLRNNGGPTQTIAPLATSPAVDAIPLSPINFCTDTSGNPVTTDQRGVARPQGAACDIGAFELTQAQTATLSQTVSFTTTAPGTASYNSTFAVAAQSNSGLTVTLSVDSASTSVCSLGPPSVASGVTSATVTMLSGTGTCTIFAIQLGNASYKAAAMQQTSAMAALVNQAALTVTGPTSVTYGTTGTATATGGSGTGLLSFSAGVSTGCSVSGTTVSVSNAGGTCTLTATKAADSNFAATTSAPFTVTLVPANQTITFTGAPATAAYGSSFTVAASASSGLTVTIGSSGACSISGGTATMTASSGTCSLTASQSGNTNYNAAIPVAQSTMATKATPTINWTTPAAIAYGTVLSSTQLHAAASYNSTNVGGTFVYTPAKGTLLTAGTQTLSVTFTPTNTTDYTSEGDSVTLQVNQATPKITWAKPAAITYGTALSAMQLDATASVAGTFVYTPAGSTVLTVGAQTLSVTFTPTDTTDYADATDTVTITVNKAALALTWPTPSPITYGAALTSTQQDATASVAGSFVYYPAAGTVLAGGSHTLSVTFTPTDTTDYATAKGSVALQVNPATPTITWATPGAITYGTSLSGTQLDATAPAGGTFVYAPAKGTSLTAGSYTLSVTFTPTNTADYTTASATVNLQVNRATPKIAWAKPAAITYGMALSATQLDATASVAGTFAYSPAAGTVLGGGVQILSVTFTPTDTTDYTTATDSVAIPVKQAAPVLTWFKPAAITYGTALTATQLDATTSVGGTFFYSPAAGTVLGIGTIPLFVTFTPTDTTDYTTATDSVKITVNGSCTFCRGTSTTVITSRTPNPSLVGQAVTVNFSVGPGGLPTGTVTVTTSTGQTCNGTLSQGTGSCSLTFTASGLSQMAATYAGDYNWNTSTSAQVTQVVVP